MGVRTARYQEPKALVPLLSARLWSPCRGFPPGFASSRAYGLRASTWSLHVLCALVFWHLQSLRCLRDTAHRCSCRAWRVLRPRLPPSRLCPSVPPRVLLSLYCSVFLHGLPWRGQRLLHLPHFQLRRACTPQGNNIIPCATQAMSVLQQCCSCALLQQPGVNSANTGAVAACRHSCSV